MDAMIPTEPNGPNPIKSEDAITLENRLAQLEAQLGKYQENSMIGYSKKPWWQSLTVQMLVALVALVVVVLVGEYGGWRGIALQVLHKILIDSFAAAVLVPIFASGALFGRFRKGDLQV